MAAAGLSVVVTVVAVEVLSARAIDPGWSFGSTLL
jgi:hypothetical protein